MAGRVLRVVMLSNKPRECKQPAKPTVELASSIHMRSTPFSLGSQATEKAIATLIRGDRGYAVFLHTGKTHLKKRYLLFTEGHAHYLNKHRYLTFVVWFQFHIFSTCYFNILQKIYLWIFGDQPNFQEGEKTCSMISLKV